MLLTDPKISPEIPQIYYPFFCPEPKHSREIVWQMLDMRKALKNLPHQNTAFSKSEPLLINITPPNMGQKRSAPAIGSVIRSCIKEA